MTFAIPPVPPAIKHLYNNMLNGFLMWYGYILTYTTCTVFGIGGIANNLAVPVAIPYLTF